MFSYPIFLCIVLVSPYSTTPDRNDMVDAAVEAITTASSGSADVLLALNSFGPEAPLLMKTVIPIAAMVVQTVNPKPQSDEYEVLMNLKNRTNIIWRDVQTRIDIATAAIGAKLIYSEYNMKVDLPLKLWKKMTDEYLDPKMRKHEAFVVSFRQGCKSYHEKSPQSILDYLNDRLVVYCGPAISPTEARELAEERASLMRVLRRLQMGQNSIPDLHLYLSEFLDIYKRIDKSLLTKHLNVYDRWFPSSASAIQALFEELQSRSSVRKVPKDATERCLTRVIVRNSFFNYPTIRSFVTKLKNQLMDVTFYAGICAEVLHHGDSASIDKYTEKVANYVMRISSFTSKFLNDSLISAWPPAHSQILDEHIKKIAPKDVTIENLKLIGNLAHPLLMNTGVPNYVYEMVIVKATETEYEHFFDGIGNHCSFKKGESGFDTVIGRIPLNTRSEEEKFELDGKILRMRNEAYELNVTIQYEMEKLYNEATVSLIADTLKKKIGKEFVTEQDFHCWGIVRQWSALFWNPCPRIDYWSSPYPNLGLNSITTLSYKNSGYVTQDCEVFRFYFFV